MPTTESVSVIQQNDLKIIAISDVHNRYKDLKVPTCDILISAGDYSFEGRSTDTHNFHKWLNEQDARYVISIPGNHELGVEKDFNLHKVIAEAACPTVHFLEEGLVEIEGLKIWCSAYTPFFCDWAYNVVGNEELKKHWDRIPEGIDILVTHGPPYGMLDEVFRPPTYEEHVGCAELWDAVLKIKPKAHIFGHTHYHYGFKEFNGIKFYNVANCGESYKIDRQPTEIML